jgi:hypothetical protein
MPQFDCYCFSTQVFWVVVIWFIFYFLTTSVYLPSLGSTIKLRGKRKVGSTVSGKGGVNALWSALS